MTFESSFFGWTVPLRTQVKIKAAVGFLIVQHMICDKHQLDTTPAVSQKYTTRQD